MSNLTDIVVEQLKIHEGFRAKSYRDSEGVLTIGYGTNLEALEIDELMGLVLMRNALVSAIEDARILFPSFDSLSIRRQSVLVNMAYNLGRTRLGDFKRLRAAVADEEWDSAHYEMLDSEWARQVGHRSVELAGIMKRDN